MADGDPSHTMWKSTCRQCGQQNKLGWKPGPTQNFLCAACHDYYDGMSSSSSSASAGGGAPGPRTAVLPYYGKSLSAPDGSGMQEPTPGIVESPAARASAAEGTTREEFLVSHRPQALSKALSKRGRSSENSSGASSFSDFGELQRTYVCSWTPSSPAEEDGGPPQHGAGAGTTIASSSRGAGSCSAARRDFFLYLISPALAKTSQVVVSAGQSLTVWRGTGASLWIAAEFFGQREQVEVNDAE